MSEIRIGVSACLLGEEVRYDGGHKRNAFLLEELARYVRFVPLSPEVGIGLGVPREPVRLVRRENDVRLLGPAGADHTEAMRRWAAAAIRGIREQDLSGFVLKKGSPSCGLERVKVWDEPEKRPRPDGRGLFAQALVDALPGLPVEEEGRLHDPGIREHFVDRVFGHARVRDFFSGPWDAAALVRFHTALPEPPRRQRHGSSHRETREGPTRAASAADPRRGTRGLRRSSTILGVGEFLAGVVDSQGHIAPSPGAAVGKRGGVG